MRLINRKLIGGGGGGSNGLLTDLIAYYPLDETSGDAIDAHGSKDATDNNTVGYVSDGILSANARSFTYTNSEYFSRASNDLITGTGGMSISIWFRTTHTGNIYLWAFGNANDKRINLRIENSGTWFYDRTGAGNTAWNTGSVVDGNWHNVVIVKAANATESTGKTLYLDGLPVTITSSSGTDIQNIDSGAFFIGKGTLTNDYWQGDLCQMGIWSRALSSDDVAAIYNSGSGLPYSSFD